MPCRRLVSRLSAAAAAIVLASCARSINRLEPVDPHDIAGGRWRVVNRSVQVVTEDARTLLRFDEHPDAGMAWNPAESFTDGEIDVDVRGRDVMQRSFVGVAFHVQSADVADVVWLRPFNFVGVDSAHHAHAVQVASYPDWSWERLREERSGQFESSVPGSIRPDAWVHLHVQVAGRAVKVFLDRSATPVLDVQLPAVHGPGPVALWVGDKSPGDFANLTIHPEPSR